MEIIHNKYHQWYLSIIAKAVSDGRKKHYKTSNKDYKYFERHHIIPKSCGGTNETSNLVLLTAREHFVCHILLTKFTTGHQQIKMMHALKQMLRKSPSNIGRTSRSFALARIMVAQATSIQFKNKPKSARHKEKISAANSDKPKSLEAKRRMSESRKQFLSENPHPHTGKKRSKETCERISLSKKGKRHSEEYKAKRSTQYSGAGNPNYGKRGELSPLYGRVPSNRKPIEQMDLEGNIIKVWDCLLDACRTLGLNKGNLSHTAKNKLSRVHGGHRWRYCEG